MSCGPTGSAAHEGFFHHSWEFCGRKGGLRAIGKAFQSAACHWSQCPQGHSPLQHPPRFQTQLLLLRGLALALLTHPAMHGHLASQQAVRGPSWYSSIPWSAECSREQIRPQATDHTPKGALSCSYTALSTPFPHSKKPQTNPFYQAHVFLACTFTLSYGNAVPVFPSWDLQAGSHSPPPWLLPLLFSARSLPSPSEHSPLIQPARLADPALLPAPPSVLPPHVMHLHNLPWEGRAEQVTVPHRGP